MAARIAVYVAYFGVWPEWISLYFETLRRNPSVDFFIFSDCGVDAPLPKNVRLFPVAFRKYVDDVNRRIPARFDPPNSYKLCDLRPLIGEAHRDLFAPYDFYGWADTDLLFGDLRSFYTEDLLARYDVFSSHAIRISGHFALFRNNEKNRTMYRKIYRWRRFFEQPAYAGMDEHGLKHAYTMTVFDKFNEKYSVHVDGFLPRTLRHWKQRKLYLVEQYTTPCVAIPWLDGSLHSAQPSNWLYRDGTITNDRDGSRAFPYLHFMNFRNRRYRHDGTAAPWEGRTGICKARAEDMTRGVTVDARGILAVP